MKLPGCAKAWDEFLNEHPGCASPYPMEEKSQAGMAGYTAAPYLAWSGWRYRIPGGPIGGQYHGYIASDDMVDGMGWPAGHDETFRPVDNPAGLGTYPWQSWDDRWGGIPLDEGETVSDYVYRGPAELRPRANASGGVNVVSAAQTQRSPGYAIAPGNYKGIGAMGIPIMTPRSNMIWRNPGTFWPVRPIAPVSPAPPVVPRFCPAWGCGPVSFPPVVTPSPVHTVPQPPPPSAPAPAPVATGQLCPAGQYQDAAGNCTSDWHNPYVLNLPTDGSSPSPAPTVAANTCPTGYTVDANGNCVVPGAPAGITDWLSGSTTIGGTAIPNILLAGAGALFVLKFMGGRR